jgi:hypothetical protein
MASPLLQRIKNGWKKAMKPLAYLALTAFLLILSAYLIGRVYEKEITGYFLSKINGQLNTRVEIAEVEFSILQHFPDATVSLRKVKAEHSKPFKAAGNLLIADRIDFRFGIFDLFGDSYSIKRIDVLNGAINILRNDENLTNYQLLKKSSSTGTDKFSFTLESLTFRNVNALIKDDIADFYSLFVMNNADLNGNFTQSDYTLKLKGDFQVSELRSGKTSWLTNRPVSLELELNVNELKQTYSFQSGIVEIADMEINVEGTIKNSRQLWLDLHLQGEEMNIKSILSLLPSGYDEKVKDYKSKGEFYGKAIIKGFWTETLTPYFQIDFGIKNGKIVQQKEDVSLDEVNLIGSFSNGVDHSLASSVLDLQNISFLLGDGNLKGSCKISRFDDPNIQMNVSASINLATLQKFIQLETVYAFRGKASLNLRLIGKESQLRAYNSGGLETLMANGNLSISDASFKVKNDTLAYTGFNGNLKFTNADVSIDQFKGMVGKSDFLLRGKLNNLFGWLFGEKQSIGITANAQCSSIYLDELFQRRSVSTSNYDFNISPRILLKISSRVNNLIFRKFKASDIVGDFVVEGQELKAERLQFSTMGGKAVLKGSVDGSNPDQLLFNCDGDLKQVNIQQLFEQCENFGQDEFKDVNIRGRMDAHILFTALSNTSLKINPAKVYAKADLVINQGELINYEPLNKLSRFISLDELKHVRFSQLKNQIEIRNRSVIIPQMDIASSALSISLSGVHSFDNDIDYHLKLLLSDVLAKKARKAHRGDEEFGEIADDGLGKMNLFISMVGPIDNPKISYDSRGAREKIKKDIASEKSSLKSILHEEFGWFKKDSTAIKPSEKGVKNKQKLIIEFDE